MRIRDTNKVRTRTRVVHGRVCVEPVFATGSASAVLFLASLAHSLARAIVVFLVGVRVKVRVKG